MADIICPKCKHVFDNNNPESLVTRGAAAAAGATAGAYFGAEIGIAGGPTEFAQTSRIRIIRKVGQQLQTIPVQLGAALKGDLDQVSARDIPSMQSGDTMVVP